MRQPQCHYGLILSPGARMVEAADGGDGDLLSWVARYGDEGSCEEALCFVNTS